jgi:undecaprenyl-diphosphatase
MDLISLLKAALLGIVEGATEFIPVSSTGHLIVVQDWLDFTGEKANAFIIFIQLGAILAVLWLYRQKLWSVVRDFYRERRARALVINLVVATLPAVAIGLPTEGWIEAHLFRPVPVALALVAGGLLIFWVEARFRSPVVDDVDHLGLRHALGIGLFQVLAILFPGISRSGATIMGGMVLGLARVTATEFSFFLAIPAMAGAACIKLLGVRDQLGAADAPVFTVGFVTAFLAALLVIRTLIVYVSRNDFRPFAWYRIAFGALLLAFYAAGSAGW